MSININGFFKDVGGAGRVTELRREKLANASPVPTPSTRSASLRISCTRRP